jgi:hypothetical protein
MCVSSIANVRKAVACPTTTRCHHVIEVMRANERTYGPERSEDMQLTLLHRLVCFLLVNSAFEFGAITATFL